MRIVGACALAMEILSQTNYNGAVERASNKLNYAEQREREKMRSKKGNKSPRCSLLLLPLCFRQFVSALLQP